MTAEQPPSDIVSLDQYRTERRHKDCYHERKVLFEDSRTLECSQCGTVLDPIDELMRLSRGRQNIAFENDRLRREIAHRRLQLADLKKQIANLKAQARRAGEQRP